MSGWWHDSWLTDWLTTHWLTDSLTHWLTDSLTHWLTHPLTHSPTHSLTHSIGPLHNAITWCSICHVGWQTAHWEIQNKKILCLSELIASVCKKSQCKICHPGWQILYHVVVLYKGAIQLTDWLTASLTDWLTDWLNYDGTSKCGSIIHVVFCQNVLWIVSFNTCTLRSFLTFASCILTAHNLWRH